MVYSIKKSEHIYMEESEQERYNRNYEDVRYKRKKRLIYELLEDVIKSREKHYKAYRKYKKINTAFTVGVGICSGVTIGTIVSGFVFPPLFILSGCCAGVGFLLGSVQQTSDI